MTDLEPLEKSNDDYKNLIDALRVTALKPYYLSKEHRQAAMSELNKVDWERQPERIKREYKRPIGLLKLKHSFLKLGSTVKRMIIRINHGSSNTN